MSKLWIAVSVVAMLVSSACAAGENQAIGPVQTQAVATAPAALPPTAPAALPPTAAPPTQAPTPTHTPAAPTLTVPTEVELPQIWNGFQNQGGGVEAVYPITLTIEKIQDNTFTGKMWYPGTAKYYPAMTKVTGEYILDFNDPDEQDKWALHPDFKAGDRSGVWLRFTETAFVKGCCLSLGGWSYGHINEAGEMFGIYFANPDVSSYNRQLTWRLKLRQ